MRVLIALVVMVAAADARADAMLSSEGGRLFPTKIDVDVRVRGQVESTTLRLEFAPIAGGSYSLTVPAPVGGSPIGVDIDRGGGFVAIPVERNAPAAPAGGSADPTLVAWHGNAPLVAELVDLTPGTLVVRARFVRLLRRVQGEVAFTAGVRRCPAREPTDPGAIAHVEVRVETGRDLTMFDVAGGTGTTVQPGIRFGSILTGSTPLAGDELVQVRYREATSGIQVHLVAHRTPTADPMGGTAGYFLLLVDAEAAPPMMPRTVSLVIDHSGSMAGDKMAQARDAARAMLDFLAPEDEFAIHVFDDDTSSFRSKPVLATAANIAAARTWIKDIDSDGSTNLDAGVRVGLVAPRDERFDALVLLSDGLANTGETDRREILRNARQLAAEQTRLFTFSVGTDADFPLMEALARGSRGRHVDLNNAQATSELVARVVELFEDIHDVRATDLELEVANIGASDLLPEAAPDLFSGGQVVIVGRYATPGIATVHLTGVEGAQPLDLTVQLDAPDLVETDDIIKYVWATERTRALIAEIAGGADEAEIRAQVEVIGVAYRIQTPYTRYSGGDSASDSASGTGCSVTAGGNAWLVVLGLFGLARRSRRMPRR